MKDKSVKYLYLITGTTRGIGRALLQEALKERECFVISLSREKSFLNGNHQNIFIDLNDSRKIPSVFDAVHFESRRFGNGGTTILINNAGMLDPISPIAHCEDDMIEQNVKVNLIAPMVLSRHFYHFAKPFSGDKWIVNITSGASHKPYYGWSPYGASKAGLDMASRAMAMEFARIDPTFHVCAVAPGTVDTKMQEKIRQCSRDRFDQVEKFIQLKNRGALFSPQWTASTLIQFLLEGRFENGGRYDLREMISSSL